jgi:hypothetical protein
MKIFVKLALIAAITISLAVLYSKINFAVQNSDRISNEIAMETKIP